MSDALPNSAQTTAQSCGPYKLCSRRWGLRKLRKQPNCPGGRSGVSRWSKEGGGAEGRCSSTTCGARCRGGSPHHPSIFRCGGESVASCRSGVDSRAGHAPCRHFRGRSTNPDSVGCGPCGDQEPFRHDGHFDRRSRLGFSEKPAKPFSSVLTTEER